MFTCRSQCMSALARKAVSVPPYPTLWLSVQSLSMAGVMSCVAPSRPRGHSTPSTLPPAHPNVRYVEHACSTFTVRLPRRWRRNKAATTPAQPFVLCKSQRQTVLHPTRQMRSDPLPRSVRRDAPRTCQLAWLAHGNTTQHGEGDGTCHCCRSIHQPNGGKPPADGPLATICRRQARCPLQPEAPPLLYRRLRVLWPGFFPLNRCLGILVGMARSASPICGNGNARMQHTLELYVHSRHSLSLPLTLRPLAPYHSPAAHAALR